MRILITGAFGNVGRSTIRAVETRGDQVVIYEADTTRNRRLAKKLAAGHPCHFGDIRDRSRLEQALRGVDAVCHLAAIIPPAADLKPELAHAINVGGTQALIEAVRAMASKENRPPARIVYASSIAAYGDRLRTPWIKTSDPLEPSEGDEYGKSKLEAEGFLRASGLPFVVLRLTYIVWRKKLARDPLMFHMPLETGIEICHTEDTGRAFAAAAVLPEALGKTLNIGGGESCRTTYRGYLDRMLRIFGLGGIGFMPEKAFAASGFHCGWYADSDEAEKLLGFRKKGLEDYYAEVVEEARWTRIGASLFRSIARSRLLATSPFITRAKRGFQEVARA